MLGSLMAGPRVCDATEGHPMCGMVRHKRSDLRQIGPLRRQNGSLLELANFQLAPGITVGSLSSRPAGLPAPGPGAGSLESAIIAHTRMPMDIEKYGT
jgi:hypothetical protein